eukprot:1299037-Rhodomonas_salina.2
MAEERVREQVTRGGLRCEHAHAWRTLHGDGGRLHVMSQCGCVLPGVERGGAAARRRLRAWQGRWGRWGARATRQNSWA